MSYLHSCFNQFGVYLKTFFYSLLFWKKSTSNLILFIRQPRGIKLKWFIYLTFNTTLFIGQSPTKSDSYFIYLKKKIKNKRRRFEDIYK